VGGEESASGSRSGSEEEELGLGFGLGRRERSEILLDRLVAGVGSVVVVEEFGIVDGGRGRLDRGGRS
jgi:hypothetical protein